MCVCVCVCEYECVYVEDCMGVKYIYIIENLDTILLEAQLLTHFKISCQVQHHNLWCCRENSEINVTVLYRPTISS